VKTTIKRKQPTLRLKTASAQEVMDFGDAFSDDLEAPAPCDGTTELVLAGRQTVGLVSYLVRNYELIITQLYVAPEFRSFGLGQQILEILSQPEDVLITRVIATPSSAGYYEKLGFSPDMGHVILAKVK
tara:strand:- start:57 stop:443 length:387 start_codon:yes stop_codon:yes gene_type:complete